MSKAATNQNSISINAKISELNDQIQWFYSDDFSLDQVEEKYKTAINLAKEIESSLETLKNNIQIIGKDFSK